MNPLQKHEAKKLKLTRDELPRECELDFFPGYIGFMVNLKSEMDPMWCMFLGISSDSDLNGTICLSSSVLAISRTEAPLQSESAHQFFCCLSLGHSISTYTRPLFALHSDYVADIVCLARGIVKNKTNFLCRLTALVEGVRLIRQF